MTPVVIQYPLDLTGNSPDNFVVGERHGPCMTGNRVFVLDYGPFYSKGLVLKNAVTHDVLTPDVDYKAVQTFIEPTLQTGKLVCSIIQIQPSAFGFEIDCDYHVLGGDYSLSTSALENLVEQLENDDRPVHWGQIIGKPSAFNPTPHLHDINDVFGWEYVVAALEAVRQAILIGDPQAEDDFYAYVDQKFGEAMTAIGDLEDELTAHLQDFDNPHRVSKDQLGLSNVGNYGLATPEIARLNVSNETLITPYLTPFAIEFHSKDFANPHQTTKAHVGLGNVDNYPTATLQQAIDGTDDQSFLTPYRARVAFDSWAGAPPDDPSVPPTPNFTYTGSRTVPEGSDPVLTFTDTSTAGTSAITTWAWDFGNGETSSLQNPNPVTFAFAEQTKTFTIVLTVTDAIGTVRQKSQSLVMAHTVNQTNPSGMSVTVNNVAGGYTSEIMVASDKANAKHTMNYTCTEPTSNNGPYTYQWSVENAHKPELTPYSATINFSQFTFNGQTPPAKTVTVPKNAVGDNSYYFQNGTCTVTSQSSGLAAAVNFQNKYKTFVQPKPVAAISLNTGASNLSSANSTLTAVFNNNSTLGNTVGESWQSSTWSFSTTSGTVNPASAYNGGDPSPATVQIVNPVIGTGKVTATVLVTTTPSGLTDTTSLQVNFTRLQPAPIGPTAAFTGNITYNAGTDTSSISVTNTSTNGDVAIVSWAWSVAWSDGTTSTSTAKNPPAFTHSGYNSGLNRSATVSLTVTDSAGLTNNTSHPFALPFQDVTRTYTSGSGVETAPQGATSVVITAAGAGASGHGVMRFDSQGGDGGGAGAMAISEYPIIAGQTLQYVVGASSKSGTLDNRPGEASTVTSGTKTITTMSAGGGMSGMAGGTATGGTIGNFTGASGQPSEGGDGGAGGYGPGGYGGAGADSPPGTPTQNIPGDIGGDGWVTFFYPAGIYRQYDTGSGVETAPAGATAVTIAVWGAGGSGGGVDRWDTEGADGGAAGAYCSSSYPIAPGQTINYVVGAGASNTAGGTSSVTSGTKTITTMTANGGGASTTVSSTATGGTIENVAGAGGSEHSDVSGGNGGTATWRTIGGINQGHGKGGFGRTGTANPPGVTLPGLAGGNGCVVFYYTIG